MLLSFVPDHEQKLLILLAMWNEEWFVKFQKRCHFYRQYCTGSHGLLEIDYVDSSTIVNRTNFIQNLLFLSSKELIIQDKVDYQTKSYCECNSRSCF